MIGIKEHEDELVTWWIFMEHLDYEVLVERKEGGGETHTRARGGLSQAISIYRESYKRTTSTVK
jgi:hypothetical protein